MNYKTNYNYKDFKKAQQRKLKRLKDKIETMITENNCLFVTMTFNNIVLASTSDKTRLRYIKSYLNEQAENYILNIDYGDKNNREHYHAIIKPKYKNKIYYSAYKYGSIKAEYIKQNRLKNQNETIEDLIERLTNHAIKDTTKDNRIIYSRNLKANIKNPYEKEIDRQILNQEIKNEHQKMMRELDKFYSDYEL